ncbi:MAG: cellulase family glycosylhydrolase [Brevefilum sp.]|nr:cellulase family glycosylhydrolase [Brevefilum sp.]
MRIQKLLITIVLLALISVSVPTNASQAQEEEVSTFGVEINQFWYPKTFDDTLTKAEAADSHWLRYNNLLWSRVQPEEGGPINWDLTLDKNLEAASKAGMEVILIIRSTPTWAQKYPGYYCGPMGADYFDDFAAFMVQVVERYSQPPYNVKYFELWNEPDESREHENILPNGEFGCWGEISDTKYFGGRTYGKMLRAVYPAVKAAVPEAQVVIGGLLLPCKPGSLNNWSYCNMSKFFTGIMEEERAAGEPIFDYANFHGYTSYSTYYSTGILMEINEAWWKYNGGMVEGKLAYLREVMASYGVSRPVLLTEAALIDRDNIASKNINAFEAAKADYLVYVFVRNIDVDITGSTWYHMDKYGWFKSGLLDSNNHPLPAYFAFQVMTTTLGGAVYQRPKLSGLPTGIIGYEFRKGDYRIWVLFSRDGGTKTINKSSIPFTINHVYDLFGRKVAQTSTAISFNRPIYIDNIPNTSPIFTSTPVIGEVDQYQHYNYEIVTASVAPEHFDVHTIESQFPLPSWLSLVDHGDGTATLSGTPVDEDLVEKSYLIDLIVTDSHGATATQSFSIWVNNVNDRPKFTSSPVIDAEPDMPYTYDIETTDQDWIHGGEDLTIEAVSKPDWLEFTTIPYNDDGIWKARLSGEPDQDDLDARPSIVLRVTDHAGEYDKQEFSIGLIYIFLPLVMR